MANEDYLKKQVRNLKQQLNDALDGNTHRLNNLRAKLSHVQDELHIMTRNRDMLLIVIEKLKEELSEQEGTRAVPAEGVRVEAPVPEQEGSEDSAPEAVA